MPHDVTLITTIAAGLGLALVMGFLVTRLGVPPLVGYLLAGIIIGPATPGFVADVHLTSQLAEIGVMLMMFGVGLHLSLGDLLAVRRIAVPGAVVQIAAATAMGAATVMLWGWSLGAALGHPQRRARAPAHHHLDCADALFHTPISSYPSSRRRPAFRFRGQAVESLTKGAAN
jgi:hypothetical protein